METYLVIQSFFCCLKPCVSAEYLKEFNVCHGIHPTEVKLCTIVVSDKHANAVMLEFLTHGPFYLIVGLRRRACDATGVP